MTWTRFMDMHSGGGQKLDWPYIYIEAPEAEAKAVFYAKFGRNPKRVTCTCCGEDYSITESPSLKRATGYERNCHALERVRDPVTKLYKDPADAWWQEHYYVDPDEEAEAEKRGWSISSWPRSRHNQWISLDQYVADPSVKIIYASEITPEERSADVPAEGYVWAGG